MGFYNNLTNDGVLFFWIVVFLSIFLLILSITLVNKNKKLKKLIEDNTTDSDENIPISDVMEEEVKEDNIVIEEKEETIIPLEENKIEDKEEVKIEIKDEVKEEKSKADVKTSGAYQKNVLREMSKKMPISPIHIERDSIDDDTYIYTVSNEDDDYDIDEVYLREDSVSPLEEMEDSYEPNDNMRFASDIISRMEEEVVPSLLELTDYERKQEEEAIISYGELEKVKDRIYNLTEEEEDGNFIDELKNFRSDL